MYPFIHIGGISIGTFGIMLWLAAVCACWALHANFKRWKIEADAISIVAIATVAGVIGAKLWHVLEDLQALIHHPLAMIFDRAGFAWFGGLVLGIAALLWPGLPVNNKIPHKQRFRNCRSPCLRAPACHASPSALHCLLPDAAPEAVPLGRTARNQFSSIFVNLSCSCRVFGQAGSLFRISPNS